MPNPPCDVCGKVVAGSPYNLEEHMRVHCDERPFQCTGSCGKSFKRKSHLKNHLALNACIPKPRKTGHHCNHCNVFIKGSPYNLKLHERTHSGLKPFQCDECEATFVSSAALTSHKRTHSGSKPYQCDKCEISFSHLSSLKIHKRRHMGYKPFVCDFDNCDAAFCESGDLIKHQRTHTGERRFACDKCDATFTQSGHVKVHKRSHTGERQYACNVDECDATFTQKAHLEKHKEAMHSKEGIQRKKKQEEATKNALVLGGYVESFERGVVPTPGQFCREVYFDYRCALADNFMPGEKKYAYVDFVVTTPDGRLVFLEVDEEQHGYNSQLCETTRMWNICQSIILADLGGDLNVFWLRVNPNSGFHVGGRTLRTPREQRFAEVLKFLDALKSSPSDPPIQIGYAFYDCEPNGRPLVLKDSEYHPDVLPGVVCISKGSQKLIQPQPFAPVNPLFAPLRLTMFPSDDEDEDESPPSPKRARALQPGEGTSSSV
jgi:hypothetical protein